MWKNKGLKVLFGLLFWLIVWQVAVTILNRNLLIAVPTPLTTLTAFFHLLGRPAFYRAVCFSLLRICEGYALAVVLGLFGGFLSARFPFFRFLFAPVLRCVRAVPVASVILLLFLWLSKGAIPIFTSFLMVFPIVWGNTEEALLHLDSKLIEMAEVMGLSKAKILKEITLPSILPQISVALTGGLGFAWKAGVAAEVIARSDPSIGNLLWAEKNAIEYDAVFALTLAVVLLSVMLEALLKSALRRWNRD